MRGSGRARFSVLISVVLLLLAALSSRPVLGAEPVVRPGGVVRWPGDGLASCAMGSETWSPLDGACFYPIDLLQAQGPLTLARTRDGARETTRVRVGKYDYPVQRLTLPKDEVELSPEALARVRRESREIARLWGRRGPRQFTLPLRPPLDPLPEGGRFGSRRIINGLPRSPHSGMDFTAPAGEPVLATADGTVALVGDHFFGGRSVFVDHGDGLISMYMHLSQVLVAEGDHVKRGQPLGAVGSSGRATGPHLHFGLRWHRARVDPTLLLGDPGRLVEIP